MVFYWYFLKNILVGLVFGNFETTPVGIGLVLYIPKTDISERDGYVMCISSVEVHSIERWSGGTVRWSFLDCSKS